MCREAYLLYKQKLNRQIFKMNEELYNINAPWNTHWSMSFTLPCVYSKRRALHRIGFVESNKYQSIPRFSAFQLFFNLMSATEKNELRDDVSEIF